MHARLRWKKGWKYSGATKHLHDTIAEAGCSSWQSNWPNDPQAPLRRQSESTPPGRIRSARGVIDDVVLANSPSRSAQRTEYNGTQGAVGKFTRESAEKVTHPEANVVQLIILGDGLAQKGLNGAHPSLDERLAKLANALWCFDPTHCTQMAQGPRKRGSAPKGQRKKYSMKGLSLGLTATCAAHAS